jgi:formylglycine-generating enzyme required for sulfatase activity
MNHAISCFLPEQSSALCRWLRALVLGCLWAMGMGLLGSGLAWGQGTGGQRLALVIGNDSYRHVDPLVNSRADAQAIGSALRSAGFRVTVQTDLGREGMLSALRAFRGQVNGGDEAIFFFAGHGVELEGSNYLLPTDIRGDSPEQVRDDAVPLQRVLDDLREKRARFSLAIIDACRNNPFQSRGRSIGGRGLAAPTAATGQMVLFSAGSGQIALDQLGPRDPVKNGVFTRVMLREMARPGVEVRELLRGVREEVAQLAGSVGREQVPAIYDQALGRFYFQAGPVAPPAPALAAPVPPSAAAGPSAAEREDRFWSDTREIGNRDAYEAYLSEYPKGRYVALARAAIARLGQAAAVAAAPPAAAQSPSPPARAGLGPPGTVFRDCEVCPEMVVIPGGRFQMGAMEGEEEAEGLPEQFRNHSQPRRWVEVRGFAAGRFEVTRGQYRVFAQETGRVASGCWVWNGKEFARDEGKSWADPGYGQDDRHPVSCVSWEDAKGYVAWLSKRTGKGYRLLSEAEWEYAARAGTTTRRYWGDDGNQSCGYANGADRRFPSQVAGASNWAVASCDDGQAWTAPAGSYRPNGFGLYDMLGNVWEWVEDCWNGSYTGAPSDGRAWTSGECGRRVLRGGSWGYVPGGVRAASRYGSDTSYRSDYAGLRVARTD